jgi:SAM-dependent methyltransferase
MPDKWEYETALQDLRGCRDILEVGCGKGDFLKKVQASPGIRAEGIELNDRAVREAMRGGLTVHCGELKWLAAKSPATYDAVCSFQVLEHVAEPRAFVEECCSLLRPGGRLIVGVPNADSYLRLQFNLLDMPPHHITRWSIQSLRALETLLPLHVRRIVKEPLASYHVSDYLGAYGGILEKLGISTYLVERALFKIVAPVLRNSPIRRFLTGHTVYACFDRS